MKDHTTEGYSMDMFSRALAQTGTSGESCAVATHRGSSQEDASQQTKLG